MIRLTLILGMLAFALSGCMGHHVGALPGEPDDATFVSIQNTRVRYVDSGGDKPPIVLIHGFAASLGTWSAVRPALEESHRVIALDLKGFGWTDRPRGDYSPRAQAALVVALLDKLGVTEPVDIVAHSWGSSVALRLAIDNPERVKRLALYDAWAYEEQLPTFFVWSRTPVLGELLFSLFYRERPDDKMASAFYDPTIIDEAFVEEVEANLDRPGTVAAALEAVRGQRYTTIQSQYASIDKPVLLLWGREDRVTTLQFGERLVSELPHASLVVFPRCGHFPMIEAREQSTARLVEFMQNDVAPEESEGGSL